MNIMLLSSNAIALMSLKARLLLAVLGVVPVYAGVYGIRALAY